MDNGLREEGVLKITYLYSKNGVYVLIARKGSAIDVSFD
jgi:hypothetical protein